MREGEGRRSSGTVCQPVGWDRCRWSKGWVSSLVAPHRLQNVSPWAAYLFLVLNLRSCVLPKPITSNKKADLEADKSWKPHIAQYMCTLTLPYLPCVHTILVGIAYNSCRWWRHWLMHQIFSSSVVQLLWYWNCLCEIGLLFLACTGWCVVDSTAIAHVPRFDV